MKAAVLVPYGTVEALTAYDWKGVLKTAEQKNLKGSERSDFKKAERNRLARMHGHFIEVYGLLYGSNTEPVIAFNRQYTVLGRLSWEKAAELQDSAVVTSEWGDYALGTRKGDAIWIAHPESTDGRRALEEAKEAS